MISQEFQFYRPTELGEVFSLLQQDLGDVRMLAGGMSLVPAMNLGIARPDAVVSLNHVQSLDAVVVEDGYLRLGALVRHRQIETDGRISTACPLLSEAAGLIADVQVRHRGSVGGSLAHADPAANYIPAMLALGARLKVANHAGERWVSARDFIRGPLETELNDGELLTEIAVPVQTAIQSSAYYRLARLHGSFAMANAAAVVDDDVEVRVVVGGATTKPVVVEEHMGTLVGIDTGKLIERIGEAVHAACRETIDDLHGSPEYRRSMAMVAAKRAVAEALRRRGVAKR